MENKIEKQGNNLGQLLAILEENEININKKEQELKQIQKENKDNKVLMKYIRTMKKLDKLKEETKEINNNLYTGMVDNSIDYLEGALLSVTLTRPYLRLGVDMKKFKEMFPKDSDTYKELIKETLCKGHINTQEN